MAYRNRLPKGEGSKSWDRNCLKKARSAFVVKRHTQYLNSQLPWFSNRLLESAPVCLWPLLFRNCSFFLDLRRRPYLLHLPEPLGSTLIPSVPKREHCQGSCEPSTGCTPGAPRGHVSTSTKPYVTPCTSTAKRLVLDFPPHPGGCICFLLWITPDKQKQSASGCLFCTFMDG